MARGRRRKQHIPELNNANLAWYRRSASLPCATCSLEGSEATHHSTMVISRTLAMVLFPHDVHRRSGVRITNAIDSAAMVLCNSVDMDAWSREINGTVAYFQ